MITGFNTDVEHNGVVYHVQTEDKGLDSPLILSLVYVGGAILASKRTHYHDLITAGFDEGQLAARLQRQHKLICAAIHAGRIEDLKRQTERESKARPKAQGQPAPPPAAASEPEASVIEVTPEAIIEELPLEATLMPETQAGAVPRAPSEWVRADYSKVIDYESTAASQTSGLSLSIVDEKKFIGGEFVKILVRVGRGAGGREAVMAAKVTLKVLGSSFRPLIYTETTGSDGIAAFYAMLPHFNSGRAAIMVSATSKDDRVELRRVIHQA